MGCLQTGGGGPASVPNLRVCWHIFARAAHEGEKGESRCLAVVLSDRRGKVSPVRCTNAEEWTGLPARVSCRHVVRGRQSSPIPATARRVSAVVRRSARATGKACEKTVKIQVTGRHAHPGQHGRLPGVVTHRRPQRAPARSKVETRATWLRGRHPLGHRPVVLLCADGSMYSQVVLALPSSSGAAVLREPGGLAIMLRRVERWSPQGVLG